MSETTFLDVRPIEPKHRFDRIMQAYAALSPEETLLLTVDHDPKCMYYTLRATRGDEAFRFEYLENGPEMWRVRVTKAGRLPTSAPSPGSSDARFPSEEGRRRR